MRYARTSCLERKVVRLFKRWRYMRALPEMSVKKPVTVFMIFMVIIIFGVIAYLKLPLQMLPGGFTAPFMHVYIPYPASTPVAVMEQIALPVEDSLSTVSNLKNLGSNSSSTGVSVWMAFREGTEMDVAYQEVTDRIERVRAELPDDVDKIYVRKFDPNDEAILELAVIPPDNANEPAFLLKNYLEPKLKRIKGVAKIDISGLNEKAIIIEADVNKIMQHKLNFYQLMQKLREGNFMLSSGYTVEGGRKSQVVIDGKFKSLDEIRNLPIGVKDLKLKDIATVEYKAPEKRRVSHVDRKRGIWLSVFKESNANTVDVCEGVGKEIDRVFKEDKLLKGYRFISIWDQGKAIRNGLVDLQQSGLFGGIFAMIIVFLFLRRIKLTVIVSLSIPFSLLMTVVILFFMGKSLNLLSLMGLMLAVGMLVDNAIVVSENIERLKAMGVSAKEAAVKGAKEVSLAITLATMTTIVVFIPMMLMGQDILVLVMREIGISIIIALLSSLFVALVLIPYAAGRFATSKKEETETITFFDKFNNLYGKMLNFSLRRKLDVFMIIILVVASSIYPMKHMKMENNLRGGPKRISIRLELPSYFTLQRREKYLTKIENILYSHKEELNLKTVTSSASLDWANIKIWLKEDVRNSKDTMEVIKKVKKLIPEEAGIKVRFRGDHNSGGGGTANVYFFGKDLDKLMELAEEARRRLHHIEGIINVDIDTDGAKEEIVAKVKREASIQKGIQPIEIESTISNLVRETPLPKFLAPDREIDVKFIFKDKNRNSLDKVKSLQIKSGDKMLPIESLATFDIKKAWPQISRRDKNTVLGLKITYEGKDMGDIATKIDKTMATMHMPSGYKWSKGNSFREMEETNNATKFALYLAAVFVLLLMGVLFESFILPFSIIISIPLAFIGSFWGLWLTNSPFGFMASTGTLILIGIVVNNGIVLIDHINMLRKEGIPKVEAIIKGSKDRSRPILMTAITTITGLIPLAMGKGDLVGISYAPLAITVIGGLTTSTMLTLFIVPVFYSLLDSLREFFSSFVMSFFKTDNSKQQSTKV